MNDRVRHVLSGVFVAGGVLFGIASVVAASHGLHGYGDVLSFLGTIVVALMLIRAGAEWSA